MSKEVFKSPEEAAQSLKMSIDDFVDEYFEMHDIYDEEERKEIGKALKKKGWPAFREQLMKYFKSSPDYEIRKEDGAIIYDDGFGEEDAAEDPFESITHFVEVMVNKCQKAGKWGKSCKRDLNTLLTLIFRNINEFPEIKDITDNGEIFADYLAHAIMACCPDIEVDLGRSAIRTAVEDAYMNAA